MYLRKLGLKNYRLFTDLEVPLHEKLTVLVGVNGSGKTSVLEGTTIAIGTLFTKIDGISGVSIKKKMHILNRSNLEVPMMSRRNIL